ncbi:hypothetical protein THSYN_14935 [Candidatus Thiodictyon syntrophicum]|uniref:Uncharacterized protein n=1 Tax=Candidatus Thiodictyon syntrophicum TaxID=1166950 RepID=A0A2K8U952_9GAMM|nr:hypothetical protein THSYN_14935 [Candidatus Thiodictyon syntrophicum]
MITAWEIVHRGEPATAAGLIVVRQAERALPQWEARVRARHPQPTPVGLLPPLLLCGATILWCILSASAGQAPRAANTASPPPIEAAPGVGLAAAIADLSPPADSATAPVAPVAPGSKFPRGDQTGHGRLESIRDEDRDGGPTSAADLGPGAVVPNHPASVQPTGSAQAGAPQGRPVTPVTDAGTSPSTQAGGAAGAQGAGTQVAPRHEDHAAADQGVAPAIPSVAFGRQPLDRTGAPSADPRRAGHPFDPVAPGLAAAPAPSPARTAPAAAPAPRLDAGLGAAQRALLARYRTELSSRSMTGE